MGKVEKLFTSPRRRELLGTVEWAGMTCLQSTRCVLGVFFSSFHLRPALHSAYFSVNNAKWQWQAKDLGMRDLLPFLLWHFTYLLPFKKMFLFTYSVWLFCKLETLSKKWALLIHHSSTENSNSHWSSSSRLNKGLPWGSDVPALQIVQHCSGNIIQLKGLVC